MEYLKNNLDNSTILPYDVMQTIYEYADSNVGIRRQIENGDCKLDDIMYQKMKRYILKKFINSHYSYIISKYDETGDGFETIIINHENINDINLKDKLLNWNHGYKHYFLWKSKRMESICGIEIPHSPNYSLHTHYLTNQYFRYKMEDQLKLTNNEEQYRRYDIYSLKQIYKMWANL